MEVIEDILKNKNCWLSNEDKRLSFSKERNQYQIIQIEKRRRLYNYFDKVDEAIAYFHV